MQDRVYSLLGLAAKAGRIRSGEFAAEQAVKEGKATLVIIACDASDNTKKHFQDMCSFRRIPLVIYGTKSELGKCIGKDMRANIAVLDQGFSEKLESVIREVTI